MVIEQLRKAREEELKRSAGPETGEPTVRDTLTDKQQSERLRLYLINRAGDERSPLAEKLLSGEALTPDERRDLNRYHGEFLAQMRMVEATRNRLRDPEYLERLRRRSPAFRGLLGEVGAQGAQEMFSRIFTPERILRDLGGPDDVFTRVIRMMEQEAASEAALGTHKTAIDGLRTRYGVSETALAEALKIEDDALRRERLRVFAARNAGIFGRRQRIEQRIAELDQRQNIQEGLDDIDNAIRAGANLLAGLVDSDPAAREEFNAALRGERRPEARPEEVLGFKETRGLIPAPEVLEEKYKDFMTAPEYAEALDDAGGDEALVRERFAERHFNETVGKRGGWGMLLLDLFKALMRSTS